MTRRRLIEVLSHYYDEAVACDDDVTAGRLAEDLARVLDGEAQRPYVLTSRPTRRLRPTFGDEEPTSVIPAETMAHLQSLSEAT